ncbi:MAG: phosphopantetheine-binding protein [Candidatus Limnocylindrales bacterium]
MSGMYDLLVDLLVNRFEVDRNDVRPEVTFDELEMDSLFLVELLLVLQSELGERGALISEDVASPSDTIADAARLIEDQIAAGATS